MHAPVMSKALLIHISDNVVQVACPCVCGDANCLHVWDVYASNMLHIPARQTA